MTHRRRCSPRRRSSLDRYKAASPKIQVEYIDPERDPLRTKTLAQEFGVSSANTVVFAAAGRKKYVTSEQLADYDYSGMQMGQRQDEGVQG